MVELYSLTGCPYCAKVEDKLAELGVDYERHEVPRAKSQREKVKELSGQTGVPVLVDPANGISGMPESSDIVEYLERTYG